MKLDSLVRFKLNVRVLPTVILFVDGKAITRFIGFQDFGMRDDFPTINIIRKLVMQKMILPKNKSEKGDGETQDNNQRVKRKTIYYALIRALSLNDYEILKYI